MDRAEISKEIHELGIHTIETPSSFSSSPAF
jgi:hypothetical protein